MEYGYEHERALKKYLNLSERLPGLYVSINFVGTLLLIISLFSTRPAVYSRVNLVMIILAAVSIIMTIPPVYGRKYVKEADPGYYDADYYTKYLLFWITLILGLILTVVLGYFGRLQALDEVPGYRYYSVALLIYWIVILLVGWFNDFHIEATSRFDMESDYYHRGY